MDAGSGACLGDTLASMGVAGLELMAERPRVEPQSARRTGPSSPRGPRSRGRDTVRLVAVRVGAWALCSLVGVTLIALPDRGPRLFSFSPAHGPSLVDGIGVVILVVGWLVPLRAIWKARAVLEARASRRGSWLAVFITGVGVGLLTASVFGQFEAWWAIGAVTLALVQVYAFVLATR